MHAVFLSILMTTVLKIQTLTDFLAPYWISSYLLFFLTHSPEHKRARTHRQGEKGRGEHDDCAGGNETYSLKRDMGQGLRYLLKTLPLQNTQIYIIK